MMLLERSIIVWETPVYLPTGCELTHYIVSVPDGLSTVETAFAIKDEALEFAAAAGARLRVPIRQEIAL